jgi:hypothetical protein
VPVSDNEYVPGPNTFADRVNNPMPIRLQIELARGHVMSIVGPTINVNDSVSDDADRLGAVPAPAPRSPVTVARQYQPAATDGLACIANINALDAARAEQRLAALTVPTPRSLRYNMRSGHLQLALLMCCVGEVQSSAIILSTSAPLYGPLAMIACLSSS